MNPSLSDNHLHLTAPSDLDRHAAQLWRDSSTRLIRPNHQTLSIDLSNTRYMDSNGIAALLTLQQTFVTRGGSISLFNPTPQVTQLLELTRMHRVLQIAVSQIPSSANKRPILVVEDEPHIRAVAEMSIKPLGHPVAIADNGTDALDLARRLKPAVIVLDYILPGMDGLETLRLLKADPETRDIPVIIMSANGNLATGDQDRFEGASVFMSKPFSPGVLRSEVHRLIQPSLEIAA